MWFFCSCLCSSQIRLPCCCSTDKASRGSVQLSYTRQLAVGFSGQCCARFHWLCVLDCLSGRWPLVEVTFSLKTARCDILTLAYGSCCNIRLTNQEEIPLTLALYMTVRFYINRITCQSDMRAVCIQSHHSTHLLCVMLSVSLRLGDRPDGICISFWFHKNFLFQSYSQHLSIKQRW